MSPHRESFRQRSRYFNRRNGGSCYVGCDRNMALNMNWLSALWGKKRAEPEAPPHINNSAVSSVEPVKAATAEGNGTAVITVTQDPRLQSAEAEARGRFPEFVAAFHAGAGSDFAVKAQLVANGGREHIWVKVQELRGNTIAGNLGNNPINPGELKLGSRVEADLSQIEDWIFSCNGVRHGMFTKPVLLQMEKERAAKK